jgi:hypothetical protein
MAVAGQMYSRCNRYRCCIGSGGVESGGVAEEMVTRSGTIYKKEDDAVNHK